MEFLEVELFESVQILDVPSSRSEGIITLTIFIVSLVMEMNEIKHVS